MPKVPFTTNRQGKVVPLPGIKLDPTVLAMAAAMMHEKGQLFEPPTPPTQAPVDGNTSNQ